MSNLDENTVRWGLYMLLGLTCLCVLLVALLVAMNLPLRRRVGNFCAHCGSPLPKDPAHGIGLGEKSFLVYTCSKCRGETILPST